MANDVKDFGDYSVKGIKSFVGHDGYGFNANLYRGKKKIAFCFDDARGGEVDIQWLDGYHGVEAQLLQTHVDSLPLAESGFGGMLPLKIDTGWFVTELVTKWEEERDLRKMQKQCKTKTLFRQADSKSNSYFVISAPLTDELRTRLKAKHGEDIEIFNDVFAKGEIPSVLSTK